MTEFTEKVRAALKGDYDTDLEYIQSEADKVMKGEDPDKTKILNELAELMYEIMPPEKKKVMTDMMYVDSKRLDEAYNEAAKLTKEKKPAESVKITEALYNKIKAAYRETEDQKYMAFRNPFENQLYLFIYAAQSKKMPKAPFDLSRMITLHAYNLIDLGRAKEAVTVLNDAIRYNPVNPDPYLEMGECFKVLQEMTSLFNVTRETMLIAATPYALARCYANLGYYCVEKHDYDSALCFYYESLIYANHPGVHFELEHLRSLTNKPLTPPTREEVIAAFEKYELVSGASNAVLGVANALADDAKQKGDKEAARFYLLIIYGLTRDTEVGKDIEENFGGIPKNLKDSEFENLKPASPNLDND